MTIYQKYYLAFDKVSEIGCLGCKDQRGNSEDVSCEIFALSFKENFKKKMQTKIERSTAQDS